MFSLLSFDQSSPLLYCCIRHDHFLLHSTIQTLAKPASLALPPGLLGDFTSALPEGASQPNVTFHDSPEKSLAPFTGHNIEVVTGGPVSTHTADFGLPIIFFGGGVVTAEPRPSFFFSFQKANMTPALSVSLLQGDS